MILIDGAHSPGSIELNLEELNADFYVGNLHKWVSAPRGSGFLWVNPKHHSNIKGAIVSHGHSGKIEDSFYWDGNRDYAGFISVAKTLTLWRGNENKIYQLLHNRLIE